MTLQEVADMIGSIQLNNVNIPFAYRAFEENEAVPPPFICYFYTGNSIEPADNKNYIPIEQLAIEVYSDTKDFALEKAVENVLNAYEMVYTREEAYIDDEKMQMVTYTMEVYINE